MKKSLIGFLGCLPLLAPLLCAQSGPSRPDHILIMQSTNAAPWKEGGAVRRLPAQSNFDVEITRLHEQRIHGWGGCFNELGWEALKALNPEARHQVMEELFGEAGCAFNLGRIPVGANDYAVDWYSLDETQDDFGLKHFSLDRDRQRLIPFIKAAQTIRPELELWASPWCPPSWMKTNHSYACQPGSVNDLGAEGRGEEMHTQFRMEAPYLSAYAGYLSAFVQAYAQEGVPIRALHPQNEFNSCQVFPSCVWDPKDLAVFIGKYLGPRFAKDQPATELWLGTVERPFLERVQAVMDDPSARGFIHGIAFQWAGKQGIRTIHRAYPDLRLMQSESECGDGSNDWKAAEYTFSLMKHYFENGIEAYMYWNLVLDETGRSRWGWVQNALVTVDKTTGKFRYNPEFQLMKHFAHFVKPGARKLATTGQDQEVLAFENPDGSIVTVLGNSSDAVKSLKIRVQAQDLEVALAPRSFSTLLISTAS